MNEINTAGSNSQSNLPNSKGIALALIDKANGFLSLLNSSLQKNASSRSPEIVRDPVFSFKNDVNAQGLAHINHRHDEAKSLEEKSTEPNTVTNDKAESVAAEENGRKTDSVSKHNLAVSTESPNANADMVPISPLVNIVVIGQPINSLATQSAVPESDIKTAQSQLFSRIASSNSLMTGKGSFKMSLTPPHLGKMEAVFEKEGKLLKITLKVESPAAAQALKDGASELTGIIVNKCQEWEEVEVNIEIEDEDEQSTNDDESSSSFSEPDSQSDEEQGDNYER